MSFQKVKLAIVGLGRWAKVLTKAAKKSKILTIEAGYSRSENKRNDYSNEFGIYTANTFEEILSNEASSITAFIKLVKSFTSPTLIVDTSFI